MIDSAPLYEKVIISQNGDDKTDQLVLNASIYKQPSEATDVAPSLMKPVKIETSRETGFEVELGSSTFRAAGGWIDLETPDRIANLESENDELHRQLDSVSSRLKSLEETELSEISRVIAQKPALFLLDEIARSDGITVDQLTWLTVPEGWVVFAQLFRSRLVDLHGGRIDLSKRGAKLLETLQFHRVK